ncbi:MAG TPA: L-glutamate gamma-semialdehyde dehydrogenase [Propionicimonas sp.]|nr:L-glutamate gamma-semialdehyde dehydrogenase [Propionicimonas sp.]HQA77602.1 L-glutamate gamma-semialdehyde dehydrogenase [Propionicimonas sp.]HQD95960.1 L-glutamate gamma-semialdehyde dehydrogenase [Propionicimonas sp.]
MDAITFVPKPVNEPVLCYAPGSPERAGLKQTLATIATEPVDVFPVIGGGWTPRADAATLEVRAPSDHSTLLARVRQASAADASAAIAAAMAARTAWSATSFDERAAVFLRAAELLAGPHRDLLNAATMLGQGKTAQQAEIDSACELIDFLRFNVAFARELYTNQPISSPGVWNRMDYRPLDGFVYAITPFNFTAIAGNLPTAPALMGNTVIWKPALTQTFAAQFWMQLLTEAGLPEGVINMLPGHGAEVSDAALNHHDLAGIHFTGSTRVFQGLWTQVGANIANYGAYPRLVGETGGKDFVVAHPSADPAAVIAALVRGAFEYSGQKCSAASRAYLPQSLWDTIKDELIAQVEALTVGDVRDFANFTSAVIDERAFDKLSGAIERARSSADAEIVAGGTYDRSEGWYVRPTLITSDNPHQDIFTTEYFGPILGIHVYPDAKYDEVLQLVDDTSTYALTGAIFATDRTAVAAASTALRHAAGNFYVNDKPTGAVVGQQPFGGSRASGTNDKAGSLWNLMRWVSPRSIKENLLSPTTISYPHMLPE